MKINEEKSFVFAKLYGLRNIQNFIRNQKKSPSKYVYIEMMACPGGCLNGGGQIKNKELKNKELLQKLNEIMHESSCKIEGDPFENPTIPMLKKLYQTENLAKIFKTSFKAIEKFEDLNW